MNNHAPADLQLNLTLEEVHALYKTVSIAIDNLNIKIGRAGPDSRHGREAAVDQRLLININREILDLLEEVGR